MTAAAMAADPGQRERTKRLDTHRDDIVHLLATYPRLTAVKVLRKVRALRARQLATGVRLVALKVIEDAPALADSGLVVVSPRGVRVQIARGFDAATLARVLATLEAAA